MHTGDPEYRRNSDASRNDVEDWEEWEDDEVITPIDNGEQVLIQPQPPAAPSQHLRPPNAASIRASRHSTLRIKRLKSRHRQKAQNAKAGIRLITDMSAFRRQPHIAHHMRPSNAKQAKFVDAAALRALEGEPSSASVGNWNWLKRNKWQSPNSASPSEANRSPNMGLSPDDRPIMIGMAMPSGEASSYEPTPVTATTGNTDRTIPTGDGFGKHTNDLRYDMQQQSFWSPDTPDTTESLDRIRPPSSVYSQATIPGVPVETSMPPVPALPASYKRNSPPKLVSVELRDDTANDDDADTPCTLFEEDGTSPKATRRKSKLSPDSAGSPSRGWWDHVVSPFADKRMTFASRKQKMDSPIAATFKQSPILKDETEPVYTAYYTSSPKTLSIAKPPIEQPSIWVNLTDYPPMPTGVLTVVGPDNTICRNSCTEPSTLWSCSLPKEDHESVAPYKPNQPTIIMQIQWDNDTRNTWKVENGNPPPAFSKRSTGFASLAGSLVRSRDVTSGFSPEPAAPSFNETWFLGETTDNIVSDEKAGEPTPFYISILQSVNDTIAFPGLRRRQNSETGNVIGNISLSDILPPPDLESDGTPAPAVLLPKPVQQPVRLFDRGLETEHYGFYTSFKRTIFLKSVTVLNQTNEGDIPLDENGGCRKTEAEFLTTWGETRMLVRMWTRKLESNTSSLLKPDGTSGDVQLRRPGTMPYPVTVTLDTHGGDPKKKLVWELPMDNRQRADPKNAKLLANDMSQGGTWINPRGSGDPKFGGFDGGTGGCKCEWVNWV
ncbi:hypothetical protein K4F52_008061 [Lecanicillium sp. MT-2017a]|nr:hypothetical protein K4F52_008061 [Lecanicillium sp. MT-2017a]